MSKIISCTVTATNLFRVCASRTWIRSIHSGQFADSCSVATARSFNHHRYVHVSSPVLSSASDVSTKPTGFDSCTEQTQKLDRFRKVQELMCVQVIDFNYDITFF
jgi:hypothetical protein